MYFLTIVREPSKKPPMNFLAILLTYIYEIDHILFLGTINTYNATINLFHLKSQHMSSMEDKVCSVPAWFDEFIFIISGIVALLFLYLPMEYIDGNPAPTLIFKGQPYTFHAFIVCVLGTSCGSRCSMYLHDRNPKAARIFRYFGCWAMLGSVVVFLWAAAPAGLIRWLASPVS